MTPQKFSQAVIAAIKKIPKGKVATYGQIAKIAGKPQGSRGVAWILNSCSKSHALPWHRVINSQGKISFPSKSKNYVMQKKLLKQEGIEFSVGDRIRLSEYLWSKKPKAPKKIKNTPQLFR